LGPAPIGATTVRECQDFGYEALIPNIDTKPNTVHFRRGVVTLPGSSIAATFRG